MLVATETLRRGGTSVNAAPCVVVVAVEHETAGIDGGISALESIDTDTAEVLNMHAQLMEQLQIQGTPGIFYFDAENKLQIQRGAPLDDDLEMILGPRG